MNLDVKVVIETDDLEEEESEWELHNVSVLFLSLTIYLNRGTKVVQWQKFRRQYYERNCIYGWWGQA